MSSKIGNDIARTSSVAKVNVDKVFPFPPGELDEKEFTRRLSLLHQRMIAQILADEFELDPYQEGVPLYLLPTDDPVMARMSLERAMRFEAGGGRANLRIIQPTNIAAK
jgi:hypothetical protein